MGDDCTQGTLLRDSGDLREWQDVARNNLSPFVHRFQTAKRKYVYDVNTRRILHVSPIVWDILEDYGSLDEQGIIAKYGKVYDHGQIKAAMSEIGRVRQEQGVFLSSRPAEVLPPDEEHVRRRLENRREQLVLNVTEDCNFRCSYCVFGGGYTQFPSHSSRAMDWRTAQAAIDEFLGHSSQSTSRVISFYGGEPLLNFRLIQQVVSHVKQNSGRLPVRFAVTTNGSLLEGEAAQFLATERCQIVLSLDGPAEIHDRHRRTASGDPTWARVASNLRKFLADHPEYRTDNLIRFNAVATRTTDLYDAQAFWSGCDSFTDSMGLEISEQKETSRSPTLNLPDGPFVVSRNKMYKDFVRDLKAGTWDREHDRRSRWVQAAVFQRPFVLFHKRGYLSSPLPAKTRFMTTCIPGARRTFVSASGDYFACERVAPCREQNIGDVAHGVRLDKVMVLLNTWARANGEQCRYCWCLSRCDAGCFATADEEGRITERAKRNACAVYRRFLDRLLEQYAGILEENPKAFDYAASFEFQ